MSHYDPAGVFSPDAAFNGISGRYSNAPIKSIMGIELTQIKLWAQAAISPHELAECKVVADRLQGVVISLARTLVVGVERGKDGPMCPHLNDAFQTHQKCLKFMIQASDKDYDSERDDLIRYRVLLDKWFGMLPRHLQSDVCASGFPRDERLDPNGLQTRFPEGQDWRQPQWPYPGENEFKQDMYCEHGFAQKMCPDENAKPFNGGEMSEYRSVDPGPAAQACSDMLNQEGAYAVSSGAEAEARRAKWEKQYAELQDGTRELLHGALLHAYVTAALGLDSFSEPLPIPPPLEGVELTRRATPLAPSAASPIEPAQAILEAPVRLAA